MSDKPDEPIELKEPSNREKKFITSYLVHLDKTKAARELGCPEHTCRQQGYNIYNRPHVKKIIEDAINDQMMSASETTKLISDTARGNLANYFKEVQVIHTPKIKVGLQTVIDQIKADIEMEDIYRERVDMSDEQHDIWFSEQESRRRRIIRYEVELEINPNAFRIIEGESELITEKQLDVDAIVADRQFAKIKAVKYTTDGRPQIELVNPEGAQDRLAKIHGLYEKDNEQSKAIVVVNIE